jgi:hypothetical protein
MLEALPRKYKYTFTFQTACTALLSPQKDHFCSHPLQAIYKTMAAFDLARSTPVHLIVQSADARLNPPESYYFIQDFFIISCGVLYALCYFSYMTRTYADKKIAGVIEYT